MIFGRFKDMFSSLPFLIGYLCVFQSCAPPSEEEEKEPSNQAEETEEESDDGIYDIRVDYPQPDNGVQFLTPDILIEPYQEVIYCYYDDYEGPTAGVVGMLTLTSNAFTHHLLLKTVNGLDETPPGSVVDCTEQGALQHPSAKFIEPYGEYFPNGTGDMITLQPGSAFRLDQNQRVLVEAHFINVTSDSVLANSAVNLELIPEEEVVTWLGGYDLMLGDFEIPPGEVSITFDCPFPAGSNVLSVGAHMHQNGIRHRVELLRGDEIITLTNLDNWNAAWNVWTEYFPRGELMVQEGDLFRTTCTWQNNMQHTIEYPEEMCVTVGVATGITDGLYCENGIILENNQ